MATIRFVMREDRHFLTAEERAKSDPEVAKFLSRYPQGELQSSSFTHHAGSIGAPQLVEVKVPANQRIESHAHEVDEIMFVLEGEVRFGNRTCRAGTSILIPGMTLYSFRAGRSGARLLNFRPQASNRAISRDELVAELGIEGSVARPN